MNDNTPNLCTNLVSKCRLGYVGFKTLKLGSCLSARKAKFQCMFSMQMPVTHFRGLTMYLLLIIQVICTLNSLMKLNHSKVGKHSPKPKNMNAYLQPTRFPMHKMIYTQTLLNHINNTSINAPRHLNYI